jgi:hypothetical protein
MHEMQFVDEFQQVAQGEVQGAQVEEPGTR